MADFFADLLNMKETRTGRTRNFWEWRDLDGANWHRQGWNTRTVEIRYIRQTEVEIDGKLYWTHDEELEREDCPGSEARKALDE